MELNKEALDRHITGNYGEDFFAEEDELEEAYLNEVRQSDDPYKDEWWLDSEFWKMNLEPPPGLLERLLNATKKS
jgi:hypothetical protein